MSSENCQDFDVKTLMMHASMRRCVCVCGCACVCVGVRAGVYICRGGQEVMGCNGD